MAQVVESMKCQQGRLGAWDFLLRARGSHGRGQQGLPPLSELASPEGGTLHREKLNPQTPTWRPWFLDDFKAPWSSPNSGLPF